jgi:hypothetical protein
MSPTEVGLRLEPTTVIGKTLLGLHGCAGAQFGIARRTMTPGIALVTAGAEIARRNTSPSPFLRRRVLNKVTNFAAKHSDRRGERHP